MDNDDKDINVPRISPFESIRRVADDGSEYWSARDLEKILAYDNYRNFLKVISKAWVACEQSGQAFSDHFVEADEMVETGKGVNKNGGLLPGRPQGSLLPYFETVCDNRVW